VTADLAPENEAPGIIKDHKFLPNPEFASYGRCVRCNLAEAAHQFVEVGYQIPSTSKYRCPDCVTKGMDPCVHGGQRNEPS
jgi:hypothetical protein